MQPRATIRIVSSEYFSTMGIPIVAGRVFESRDRTDTPPVAVVSASFARRLASDGVTVGRRLRVGTTGQTEWEVVGVIGDVQVAALDADSPPVIYLSHLQAAENRMMLVLRTELGVATVANRVREIVKSLDAGVPVYAVTTLDRQLTESKAVFSRRFPMILCGLFAAAALALTLVALYAICMHEASTRRREFGIRIALGGTPGSIRRLIFNDAILVGAIGVVVGLVVATLVSRSMGAVLFGISATDWRVYGIVAAAVLASAFVATLGPALRAGSVHPSAVMREE
jgi:ABC-type lipoprotein release transport system permease subunit